MKRRTPSGEQSQRAQKGARLSGKTKATAAVAASALPALRNEDPQLLETHGFVECGQLIDPALCAKVVKTPMRDAASISNAFEKNLKGPLLKRACASIGASRQVADAVHAAFGVRTFAVRTVKVLVSEPAAAAQIPHADDFCNRELFGIAHLLPDQPRTE